MPRSTNAAATKARKKRILSQAKGYRGRRKNVWTVAKGAVEKGWAYAYIGRKQKKRYFRSLWIMRINAAARLHGISYARLMEKIQKAQIGLNRKALADLAMHHADAFKKLVEKATGLN